MSIAAHSLGSVLCYDVLCHQPWPGVTKPDVPIRPRHLLPPARPQSADDEDLSGDAQRKRERAASPASPGEQPAKKESPAGLRATPSPAGPLSLPHRVARERVTTPVGAGC